MLDRSLPIYIILTLVTLCLGAGFAEQDAEFKSTKEGIVGTYRKSGPEEDFATVKSRDEGDKPRVMARQRALLEERYDLSDRPSTVKMSGGRKSVQQGVRVKLAAAGSWDALASMPAQEIQTRGLLPK